MLFTLFSGLAFAGGDNSNFTDETHDILTQTLGDPVGLSGFDGDWDANPDKIVNIAVQFVTPSAVALRLRSAEDASGVSPFSESDFEAQALEAHAAFETQLLPLTRARTTSIEVYSEHHNLFNGVFMRVPAHMVSQIAALPEVFSVTPSLRYTTAGEVSTALSLGPGDFMRESWDLFQINHIHNTLGFTGRGVRVAVLDTGVDYNHPELRRFQNPVTGRIRGQNFTYCHPATSADPNDIMDHDGHGTHVSGIVIALAPDVELWHYKVLDDEGRGENAWVISGIEAAHRDQMDIMNLSLGSPSPDPFAPTNVAVNLAVLDGIVVVNSVGNRGLWGPVGSPASASLSIAVAAGTAGGSNEYGDQIAAFSSRGPIDGIGHIKPDITAPGVGIISTVPGGGYVSKDGTSMAAPQVAGVAALMLEAFPDIAPSETKARMMNTARPLASGESSVFAAGAGFIDPIRAFESTSFATVRHNIPWLDGDRRTWREETMASLSFGGVWRQTESVPLTVTIHNPGIDSWIPSVHWNSSQTDVSLHLVESNTSGASHTYTYQMRFDATAADGLYEGNLAFTNGPRTITMPFAADFRQTITYPICAGGTVIFPTLTDILIWAWRPVEMLRVSNTSAEAIGPVHVSIVGNSSEAFSFDGLRLPASATDIVLVPDGHDVLSFSLPSIEPGLMEYLGVTVREDAPAGIHRARVMISGEHIPTHYIDLILPVRELVNPFIDVTREHWFFISVMYAYDDNLMRGTSEHTFSPDIPLSRAMMVTILHRRASPFDTYAPPNFIDVPEDTWYSDAVAWAAHHGIVKGVGDGRFAPHDNITREEMATMFYRVASMFGWLGMTPSGASLTHFPDHYLVSDWAQTAMLWAVSQGFFRGDAEGFLNPTGSATRAECATVLHRHYGWLWR